MPSDVLKKIHRQIDATYGDLKEYLPRDVKWASRAKATAKILIPALQTHAIKLKTYVEGVLNAPVNLRRLWKELRLQSKLSEKSIRSMEQQFQWDDVLRETISGETVSKVVTKYLTDNMDGLRCNGRSDYPDLYLASKDYGCIPVFSRKRQESTDTFGAARKGKEERPVRVPDGLEIKTCRQSIRVDCHHPHAGLHLVMVFTESSRLFVVTGIWVGFLHTSDYRESKRNTTATTVKYSFNGSRFINLLANK